MIRMTIMAIGNMIIVGILLAMIMLSGCAVKVQTSLNENFLNKQIEIVKRFNKYKGQNISLVRKAEPEIIGQGSYFTYTEKGGHQKDEIRIGLDKISTFSNIVVKIYVNEENIIYDIKCIAEPYDHEVESYY